MEDKDNARVAGVAGLVGVRSDKYYYVGKLDNDVKTIGTGGGALGPGYVALKDAYEIVVQHRPLESGATEMLLLPLPIGPFHGPTRVIVRVDAYLDLSTVEDMAAINRAMTGQSGVLLPKTGPLPRGLRG